jgi:hypothetical protein
VTAAEPIQHSPEPLPGQYSLAQILGIWALGAGSMGLLAWVVYPALARVSELHPGILLWIVLLGGQWWLTILSLIILYREQGTIRLSALRERIWWQRPRLAHSEEPKAFVWLWLLPVGVASVVNVVIVWPILERIWASVMSLPPQPPGSNPVDLLDTLEPEATWVIIGLIIAQLVSTYALGEGFLFRSILLPKMRGVFGKFYWLANGFLYAVYHVHKPWFILSALPAGIIYAEPTRDHRSAWLGAIAHSAEGFFLLYLVIRAAI